jgi:arylsulfatase A-like enzyme
MGYEEDIRVPLFVRGPSVPAGSALPHLAGIVDLAPTLAEMAGIQELPYADGRSLLPLLSASPPASNEWRQAFLFEQYVGDHRLVDDPLGEPLDPFDSVRFEDVPLFYIGLRTAGLKYIEYGNGERELYDLDSDPYELENSYASADPLLLSQMSAWVQLLYLCDTFGCRNQEMGPPPPLAADPLICPELDFDGSQSVTILDIGQLAGRWGNTPQSIGWDPRYDLDRSLRIDAADLIIIAERWEERCGPHPLPRKRA